MALIKRIEVNYLRSLYSADLKSVGDLNVIFGRNDSGKSNLLRALNLFFNDMPDAENDLEFDIDFSGIRRIEAQKVKGRQFIWVKLTFSVPENYRNSLGAEFSIKRQWNRDGVVSETIFPSGMNRTQVAQVTKLRNQIDFTYIPAIKDIEVYADLIERMYGAAADSEALTTATNTFVDAIQEQTINLSSQLQSLFNQTIRLAPPTEMKRLFRFLDFSHGDEGHSLLRQKGDGVKARHLPELLRFINENEQGKKFFIWGFEEPENSLDLGAAEAEAARFVEFAGRPDTQIFVTSHSPAFYLAANDKVNASVRRFFITKQVSNFENEVVRPVNAAASIDSIGEADVRMHEAGLMQLPFVIGNLSRLREEKKVLSREVENLALNYSKLVCPTLFVEGRHDRELFELAFNALGVGDLIKVSELGGTPKSAAEFLRSIHNSGSAIGTSKSFFLFDNDKAGRQALKNIAGTQNLAEPYVDGGFATWVLPFTSEFREFMNKNEISDEHAFFTAEFLIEGSVAAAKCAELVRAYNGARRQEIEQWMGQIHGDYWPSLGQRKLHRLMTAEEGTIDWLFARGVPEFLKGKFSESLSQTDRLSNSTLEIAGKVYSHLAGQ